MGTRTERRRVLRITVPDAAGTPDASGTPGGPGPSAHRADMLAVEEPLEIRIGGRPLTVTMRTPGDDIDLAAGFLFCEGLLNPSVDLRQIRMCDENVADVTLEPTGASPGAVDGLDGLEGRDRAEAGPDGPIERATDSRRARRNFLTTSACGVCGKESIDAIRVRSRYQPAADPVEVSPGVLAALPGRLREAQRVFASTGGLHAAGLFDSGGSLLVLREDVGRHNAVDKIVGWALREGRLPLAGHVLLVSGRASFELVQKAYMAAIPLLAAVSDHSPLDVGLAEETGMTLVGFLRGTSMNVYTGERRVAVPAPAPART